MEDSSPEQGIVSRWKNRLSLGHFFCRIGNESYDPAGSVEPLSWVMCAIAEACRQIFVGLGMENLSRPRIAVACFEGRITGVGMHFEDPKFAIQRALEGCSNRHIELMVNFPIGAGMIDTLLRVPEPRRLLVGRDFWRLRAVFAPQIDREMVHELLLNEICLMTNPALFCPRFPEGDWADRGTGTIHEKMDFVADPRVVPELVRFAQEYKLTGKDVGAMIIAWAAAWFSRGLALANRGQLIGLAGGEPHAVKWCLGYGEPRFDQKDAWFASVLPIPDKARSVNGDGLDLIEQANCRGGYLPLGPHNASPYSGRLLLNFVPENDRGFV